MNEHDRNQENRAFIRPSGPQLALLESDLANQISQYGERMAVRSLDRLYLKCI